ncbi:MAG: protein-glutamate O-methyltransferase CheR [Alphaproteobacteria bacterium]
MTPGDIQDIEIKLVLEALRLRYGYDFRHYDQSSVRRRVLHCLESCKLTGISDIIPKLLYEGMFLERLIGVLTISVTTMFRDPLVFRALREYTVPALKTHPFVNIWSAGCATGEEVYSLAILLREEGLYEQARIYATDLNADSLATAREGIYALNRLEEFEANYRDAGGVGTFRDYCEIDGNVVRMNGDLKKNIVYSSHNLATDSVFAVMNLVMCRNVIIYFDASLQKRVIGLFHESLARGGDLCLGGAESLDISKSGAGFSVLSHKNRIFRKGFERTAGH